MTLNLIGLATVKEQLGISDPTHDASLTAMIPIVSADVRRILQNNFDYYTPAEYAAGSDELDIFKAAPVAYKKILGGYVSPLKMGLVVTGSGIPVDTYITAEDPETGVYTMSNNATEAGIYVYTTITIAQWPTISKMIWYKVSKQTTASASEETVQSKSFGPLSVNFGSGQINKRWNYPQALIDDLGFPYAGVC